MQEEGAGTIMGNGLLLRCGLLGLARQGGRVVVRYVGTWLADWDSAGRSGGRALLKASWG